MHHEIDRRKLSLINGEFFYWKFDTTVLTWVPLAGYCKHEGLDDRRFKQCNEQLFPTR